MVSVVSQPEGPSFRKPIGLGALRVGVAGPIANASLTHSGTYLKSFKGCL